ncbi:VOC family protein [Actinomadura harenae]|uniref:VOC family protein n=1 Tax=Actinomadura harenae TaxID=2483351 RepID=A0A3M2LV55_9ACTN|nr:VOC family protein [Actinomadura harenae]RMI41389.1 VOC family protein [Actinomadura harenae]
MTIDLFAGIAVSDYPAALAWYERLFGTRPEFEPNDRESVWKVAEHRYVYVVHLPERAGHALHTVFTSDYDDRLSGAVERGLAPARRETYENGVRKATFSDPDGNEFAFAGDPPAS